ncbi:hypothetical protein EIP86_004658 [Pleurotus ostreatoroseus]|nr:hypothetical protein EIP86_004658 [Pleurotus ostreatoroseus]
MTDEELTALGFIGENVRSPLFSPFDLVDVPARVKDLVEAVKADPEHLGSITCSMVECVKRCEARAAQQDDATDQPDSPSAETLFSQLSTNPDARTVVAPNLISEYEMNFYYHGISGDPPQLLWRSDFESNPFPIPPVGTSFHKIPEKTVRGVFNTPLNDVWHSTVAPQIIESMKARGLKFSTLGTARFSTAEDGKEDRLGPIVIWIAVHPNTTNAAAVRDATPDILDILTRAHITGVVVEWFEGSVVRL